FHAVHDIPASRNLQILQPLSVLPPANTGNRDTQRVRAIVLPSGSPQYHYAPVELRGYSSPLRTIRWLPQISQIFGDNITPADAVAIDGMGGRRLRFPLHFFFEVPPDTMPRVTHLQMNESVSTLAGDTPHPWKGNIVVLKFNGGRRRGYQDVEDSDLRAIAQFFFQKRAA
ncbi:hypothetical protein FRC07_013593, partial [Ceratobasidium sp. 392]